MYIYLSKEDSEKLDRLMREYEWTLLHARPYRRDREVPENRQAIQAQA